MVITASTASVLGTDQTLYTYSGISMKYASNKIHTEKMVLKCSEHLTEIFIWRNASTPRDPDLMLLVTVLICMMIV